MVPLTASAARITLVAMTDDAQQTPAVVAPHKKVGMLPPYAAGKPPVAVPGLHPYKLSSNENPYAPVSGVIDRVRQGAVTDFLDFHALGWHWPAFNIADMAIVGGAIALVAQSFMSVENPAATKESQ